MARIDLTTQVASVIVRSLTSSVVVVGIIILLLNKNFGGISGAADTSLVELSSFEICCLIICMVIIIGIFRKAVLPLLRSFFISSGVTTENYLKFGIVTTLLVWNPYQLIAYPTYALSIAAVMITSILLAFIAHLQVLIADKKQQKSAHIEFLKDRAGNDLNEVLSESQLKTIDELKRALQAGQPGSIGLTGPWGVGKSAIYHKAKSDLANNEEIIWVDFESWRYTSEESLVKGFYDSIAKAIGGKSPDYRGIVTSMNRVVNQFISIANSQLLTSFFATLSTINDLDKPDSIIKEALDREKKRLVIVVDDIERHYSKSRIYRTLQLVHHAKSTHDQRIQILCIYEKEAIIEAAPAHAPDASIFLEKFTEMEISVLPPSNAELQISLERYVKKYENLLKIGNDFSFSSYEETIGEIASYRAAIRIFNDLIRTAHANKDRQYSYEDYVCFEDRFAMTYIKLMYPIIYQDIYKKRKFYVESSDPFEDIEWHLLDDERKKSEFEKHVNSLMQKSRVRDDNRDIVTQTLCNLFPVMARGLKRTSTRSNVSSADLKSARHVAHSDILDAYFNATARIEEYNSSESLVNQTISQIEQSELEDEPLIKIMHGFMIEAERQKIEAVAIFLMQQTIDHYEADLRTFKLPVLRAWLRACLKKRGGGSELAISHILSKADELIRLRTMNDDATENRLIQEFFKNIVLFIEDPKNALLLLFYLIPERGNNFFMRYIQHEVSKQNGLFLRVLSHVTRLITSQSLNIYEIYDYGDWSFTSYQWANSISNSGQVNHSVLGWKKRHIQVTTYLETLLKQNDTLAYKVVTRRFKDKVLDNSFESERGKISPTTFLPLQPEVIAKITSKLQKSPKLSDLQKEEVRQIHKKLVQLNSGNNSN